MVAITKADSCCKMVTTTSWWLLKMVATASWYSCYKMVPIVATASNYYTLVATQAGKQNDSYYKLVAAASTQHLRLIFCVTKVMGYPATVEHFLLHN